VVESFEKTPLVELAEAGVPWPLVYLLEEHGRAEDEREGSARTYAAELADPAAFAGFSGVGLPLPAVDARRVRRLHDAGLEVWAWTLRPENRFLPAGFRRGPDPATAGHWLPAWVRLLSTGVDGVFADDPCLAIRARNAVPPAAARHPERDGRAPADPVFWEDRGS
jgi:glycerophosphoryl diester phosphodiesterase